MTIDRAWRQESSAIKQTNEVERLVNHKGFTKLTKVPQI